MSGGSYDTVRVAWAKGRVRVGTPNFANSREAFVEAADITSEAQAISYGEQWLALHGVYVDQIDIGVQPTNPALIPWSGVGKGDAIRTDNRSGTLQRARVHGVGFSGFRRNGEPRWTYTLGSASQERAVNSQRQLTAITQGTMSGSFKAGQVSIAPSFGDVSTSALPKRTLRIADTDELSTTSPADRTKPLPFDEAESVIRLECAAESLVGSTDSIFEIWRVAWATDGTTIAQSSIDTFTWPGDRYRFTYVTELLFTHGQGMQLVCTQAGAHALVSIQPISSSAN